MSSDLITELAARRSLSGNVADSSLAETLALFLWLTETLENQELQLLSTQVIINYGNDIARDKGAGRFWSVLVHSQD